MTEERVVALAREGLGRNEISRRTGVPKTRVTALVRAAGLSFDRAGTAKATQARSVDLAERRSRLASRLLIAAEYALAQVPGATADAMRNYMTAAGIATSRHLDLVAAERAQSDTAAVELTLASLAAGLAADEDEDNDGGPVADLDAWRGGGAA